MISKNCIECGQSFSPRATENSNRFKARECCSNRCAGARRSAAASAKFWDHVDKSGDCWTWQRFRCPKGYGRSRFNGKPAQAHRVAYLLSHPGVTLSPDQFVCHSCDNPPCVNPDHLFIGDALANNRDKVRKGRASYHNPPSGSRSAVAKFVEGEVVEIRKIGAFLLEQGMTLAAVSYKMSKAYNCNWNTIKPMLLRKTWKHV